MLGNLELAVFLRLSLSFARARERERERTTRKKLGGRAVLQTIVLICLKLPPVSAGFVGSKNGGHDCGQNDGDNGHHDKSN